VYADTLFLAQCYFVCLRETQNYLISSVAHSKSQLPDLNLYADRQRCHRRTSFIRAIFHSIQALFLIATLGLGRAVRSLHVQCE